MAISGREQWIRIWHRICLEPTRGCVSFPSAKKLQRETWNTSYPRQGQMAVQVQLTEQEGGMKIIDLGPSTLSYPITDNSVATTASRSASRAQNLSPLQRLVDEMDCERNERVEILLRKLVD